MGKKNLLLVYPICEDSYWNFQYFLDLFPKPEAHSPPLGLLTVAALLPDYHNFKIVDMNCSQALLDHNILWADYVLISAMLPQRISFNDVIKRCNRLNRPTMVGGPYPTSYRQEIEAYFRGQRGVDCYVIGETEEMFSQINLDLEHDGLQPEYIQEQKPDVRTSPPPRFDLININDYMRFPVQFSRGCPFDCDFCDITKLYGRIPRTKTPPQFLNELTTLYDLGWRGMINIVDDNFIGRPKDAEQLLDAIIDWQDTHGQPFVFITEATLNLAKMPRLLEKMERCSFFRVFLGIETTNDQTLINIHKKHNTNRNYSAYDNLLSAVHEIHAHGIQVMGGFIIGLDGDRDFNGHVDIIREAGITFAMVGLLTALNNTNLYHRLKTEGRLLSEPTGGLTDGHLNFVPELGKERLLQEYVDVILKLYGSNMEQFFLRSVNMFVRLKYVKCRQLHSTFQNPSLATIKFLYRLCKRGALLHFLSYLYKTIQIDIRFLPDAFVEAMAGCHLTQYSEQVVREIKLELEYSRSREDLVHEFSSRSSESRGQPV